MAVTLLSVDQATGVSEAWRVVPEEAARALGAVYGILRRPAAFVMAEWRRTVAGTSLPSGAVRCGMAAPTAPAEPAPETGGGSARRYPQAVGWALAPASTAEAVWMRRHARAGLVQWAGACVERA